MYSSGKLVAEYSTQVSTNPTISYTTADHLGSPRVITDQVGAVKSRRDFMPFGEDIFVGVGGRTGDSGQKYASSQDNIRQKFTGYQKDSETSLDFAEARMYENRYGRFTAVDSLLASGRSTDPQTFNRYVYTSNNPITRVDRNGKNWYVTWEKENGQWYIQPEWCEGPGCRGKRWGSSGTTIIDGKEHTWDASSFTFASNGRDGRDGYSAFDFYENRSRPGLGTLKEAQDQIRTWNRQAAINLVAGVMSGYSIAFEFSGAAAGVGAETDSGMFKMGARAGTGGSIAAAFTGVGLAPFVGKMGGEALRIFKGARLLEGPLSSFAQAGKFGFGSYKDLLKASKGMGFEVHHLIEKRFAGQVGQNANDMLSIVLTKGEHEAFTKAWRQQIGYGAKATKEEIENAARVVYKNYPELLSVLGLN